MALASISGVALAPGVSRNRRLYTPELIAKAAKRMQERLSDPNGLPIVMRTHHDAGDDSARIVGRITEVTVDNNKALRYKANLYDTFHAREIANLVTPDQPALRSVSIHGYWMGDTKQVQTNEGLATTAEDLEIDAIDFTASPGVDGAIIDGPGKAVESGGVYRTPISETVDASITIDEAECGLAVISKESLQEWHVSRGVQYELDEAKYSSDDKKSMLAKGQAMKNASGDPSYPIADVSDLKKAIHAVGRGGASHDAVRRHIIKRAKALGQSDLIPDNWNSDGTMKETEVRLGDVTEYYPGGDANVSGFCIDAYSGPLSVTIRGCVSPDQLRAAATAAACAAMDAINCMDPDDDADIDSGIDMGDDSMETKALPSGAVSKDDDMDGVQGESLPPAGTLLTRENLRAFVEKVISESQEREVPVSEMTMTPDGDGHSHSHDIVDGVTHSHSHPHDHSEAAGDYTHQHPHTHIHGATDEVDHVHGHDHIHMTSSSATAETVEGNDTKEESAMGDTQEVAAEAAPKTALTAEDMKLLGETIGNTMAEALKAFAEMNAPKHAAAAPQETTEKVEDVAESAPEAPVKADDLVALKESLANELRKELRNELRAEILEEKGLPPRRGYRLTENDEPEEMTEGELFDKHRAQILLGNYGLLEAPAADSTQAA